MTACMYVCIAARKNGTFASKPNQWLQQPVAQRRIKRGGDGGGGGGARITFLTMFVYDLRKKNNTKSVLHKRVPDSKNFHHSPFCTLNYRAQHNQRCMLLYRLTSTHYRAQTPLKSPRRAVHSFLVVFFFGFSTFALLQSQICPQKKTYSYTQLKSKTKSTAMSVCQKKKKKTRTKTKHRQVLVAVKKKKKNTSQTYSSITPSSIKEQEPKDEWNEGTPQKERRYVIVVVVDRGQWGSAISICPSQLPRRRSHPPHPRAGKPKKRKRGKERNKQL